MVTDKMFSALKMMQKAADNNTGNDNSGVSEKKIVYQKDKIKLYRFKPLTSSPSKSTPLLIVFALVNRHYIMDITEKCSLIRDLLKKGLDIYLIDWGYPDAQDASVSFAKYMSTYLKNCIKRINNHSSLSQINLMGVCQGGVFSLCYSAMYPRQIKNLILIATPVDFHTSDNVLGQLVQNIDIDLMVNTLGNIPGNWLTQAFMHLKPYHLLGKKYLKFMQNIHDKAFVKNFLAVEQWIFDVPDQAGEAFREFVKEFYQKNNLIKGKIVVGKRKINLAKVAMPILNIMADKDNLIPPSTSFNLNKHVASSDYSQLVLSGGHIGIYLNDKTRKQLSGKIAKWIKSRP